MSKKNEVLNPAGKPMSSREWVDAVGEKVDTLMNEGNLVLPDDYSPQNALKSAYLKLAETKDKNDKPVLSTCTKTSIYNALMDMVVQGLSPAKNQCYFVAYGNQLTLMRSYMGTVAVAKRLGGIKDVYAYCLYEGDIFETEFDVETSLLKIKTYEPDMNNIDVSKIIGAFAILKRGARPDYIEVMNFAQIKAAWNQRQGKGLSPAHNNFGEEMAKKTVINRACKMFINTSSDSEILTESFNRSTENDYINDEQDTPSDDIKSESAKDMENILFGGNEEEVIDVESTPITNENESNDSKDESKEETAFEGTENPFDKDPTEEAKDNE